MRLPTLVAQGDGIHGEQRPDPLQDRGHRPVADLDRAELRQQPGLDGVSLGGLTCSGAELHGDADQDGDEDEDHQIHSGVTVRHGQRVVGGCEEPVDEQERAHRRQQCRAGAAQHGDHDDGEQVDQQEAAHGEASLQRQQGGGEQGQSDDGEQQARAAVG